MTATAEVGYPTLGEVIRFVFKATGVLPGKRDQAPGFDARQRANIRKLLERLANEEGDLSENMGNALQQWAYLLTGYVESLPLNFAIGEVIHDLLDLYRNVVREEGTYLSESDTLRWMIAERLAQAAAVSVVRNITRLGLRAYADYFPDCSRWYLPDHEDGKLVLPLAKVMRWVYAQAGLSQTQFHYPGRTAAEEDAQCKQDLENAQNWIRGRFIPSAAALDWTFGRGFTALRAGDAGMPSGQEARMRREGIRTALLLARCASVMSVAMREQLGDDFLRRTVDAFARTLALGLDDAQPVETWIAGRAQLAGHAADVLRLRAYAYESWFDSLQRRGAAIDARLQALLASDAMNEAEIGRMLAAYGPFMVLPAVEMLRSPAEHGIPAGFGEALLEGTDLGRDRELTDERIDVYASRLSASGMAGLLAWIVPWLRFQVCYRCGDDAQAFTAIEQAFEQSRYRAGSRQYQIVNHYIEMAAKLGDKRAFHKGVYWSRYLGIEVRWLRDKEPTQENLDFVMAMMRSARYGV